ncbi:4-hydroxybenzoate octaprenyl transferase related protein [Thermoplasma acidophilum]|uniref:4-hydroxybenzoate octaprenyl transferase related protein n=1 Tax=Thermoplasma acidophilum (strain ATCC 25905 / DSM 1728 / JCM 9062 / NBRC 15155 / AMRC-C165) TaxID=273075 RepID=Q9HIX8_THEAC|nr:UbiA-like polyprenyltransferase [Thermoplasma acidophilum]MCY0852155.1 putative 4-hydroxybenzoate polyprenyltransferase [Thermoplasma acidophilum]CAC12323.1 4-hydroxybenzoate octaprenyl transferase related protein [Thermoplasma acidophilum]
MNFRDIVDYIKLEHTVFDLPFIFTGYVLAAGRYIYPIKILLILIAAVSARASAMSINRIEGLRYDVINPRKKDWALVSGRISKREAIAMTIFFIALFEMATYFLNRLVFILSPVVIFLFLTDPLLKRITPWRHVYMGSTIGVGVLAGYLAVIPAFPRELTIYLIFIGSSFWIAGFDVIYVIPDIEYDRINGLKTLMVRYGLKRGLQISIIFHAVTLISFWAVMLYVRTYWYLAAMIVISFLVVYQHVILDPSKPETVRRSFFNANSFIGFLYLISLILGIVFPIRM